MGCSGDTMYENINNNFITAEIIINQDNLNCQIINSINHYISLYPSFVIDDEDFEEGNKIEQELKNSEILINNKRIKFDYFYNFKKRGRYTIKYIFKNPLTSLKFLFCRCDNIISLDFSEFNTTQINNMEYLFSDCTNLSNINLSNFNTSNVKSMKYTFNQCTSLKYLDLSSFNFIELILILKSMFSNCSH